MSGARDRHDNHHAAGPSRIVLVEDDDDCRETISETLRDAGYTVNEAVDGEEALRLLRTADELPVAVVLDVRLPGISGREVLEEMKKSRLLSRIPVVLTSAGRPCDADGQLDACWLAKPFDAERLLGAVRDECAKKISRLESQEPESERQSG